MSATNDVARPFRDAEADAQAKADLDRKIREASHTRTKDGWRPAAEAGKERAA